MSEQTAEAGVKEITIQQTIIRACPQCGAANPTAEAQCPECGADAVIEVREVETFLPGL